KALKETSQPFCCIFQIVTFKCKAAKMFMKDFVIRIEPNGLAQQIKAAMNLAELEVNATHVERGQRMFGVNGKSLAIDRNGLLQLALVSYKIGVFEQYFVVAWSQLHALPIDFLCFGHLSAEMMGLG